MAATYAFCKHSLTETNECFCRQNIDFLLSIKIILNVRTGHYRIPVIGHDM